jgi:hypothetical protein
VAVAALVIIASATLVPLPSPSRGRMPSRFLWCIGCGEFGGLDVLNNILLFLPFGAALAAMGWRLRRVVPLAFALSASVEALQVFVVPGRFGSASDVLMNTLGAGVGLMVWRYRAWGIRPSARPARVIAFAVTAGVVAVLAVSAMLLQIQPPEQPLYAQWTPYRGAWFPGRLLDATLNGAPLPPGRLSPARRWAYDRQADARTLTIAAHVRDGGPVRGIAPIVRVVAEDEVQLALVQRRETYGITVGLRSRAWRLRTINLMMPGAPAPTTDRVTAGVTPTAVWIRTVPISAGAPGATTVVALSPGLGWMFITPWNVWLDSRAPVVSAVWLALLMAVAARWAAAAFRTAARSRVAWLVGPALVLSGALIVIPTFAGIAAASWLEWMGAGVGWTSGFGLSLWFDSIRPFDSGARPQPPDWLDRSRLHEDDGAVSTTMLSAASAGLPSCASKTRASA